MVFYDVRVLDVVDEKSAVEVRLLAGWQLRRGVCPLLSIAKDGQSMRKRKEKEREKGQSLFEKKKKRENQKNKTSRLITGKPRERRWNLLIL